jgi:hypothetical protein
MTNGSVWSSDYEKVITNLRQSMILEGIKNGLNVIVDNVNIDKYHFDNVVRMMKNHNYDVTITEKCFYVPLEEAILRDSKRLGKAQVGEEVVTKFWKKLGGKGFQNYVPRTEIILNSKVKKEWQPLVQDATLPKAVVFDNDGTISIIHGGRSAYNASTCDEDLPHPHVIEALKLYANAGYKIFFVSGREEKDREPTKRFYQKHFPEIEYELFMRPTGDMRKDVLIKQEIYNNHLKDKVYIAAWFDDRLQIVKWLYEDGFPVFRVNDPEATF